MNIDVVKCARLANLTITPSGISKFEDQLSEVVNYVNKLSELNTDNVMATCQTTGLENVYAEDKTCDSMDQESALIQAISKTDDYIKVKGVFEEA